MSKEELVWETIIFGTILFILLGSIIVSFIFLYQRKKNRHRQEVDQMRENFTKEILYSKNEIQEQTLKHIASEMHDNFSPTLSVINLNLAGVASKVDEHAKETILDTKTLVKQIMAEMKVLSATLNTDQISKIGLQRSLEQYISRYRKTEFNIAYTTEGDEYRLPVNTEIILFRMCQEALNNIVKHSGAKNILIHLLYAQRSFGIEIRDDGKGFDPEIVNIDPEKENSTGLRNLKNRALVIEATLVINSRQGSGTTITIILPR